MTLLEAIDARSSRRTYDGTPLSPADARAIRALICEANAASGLALALVESGDAFSRLSKSYGMFSGVPALVAVAGKRDCPDLFYRLGYRGERIVLEATRLGLATCWVSGTFDRAALGTGEDEILAAVIAIGRAPQRKSAKERLIARLTGKKGPPAERYYESDSEPPEWFLAGVRAALAAPSAMNVKHARFRFAAGKAEAYVVRESDMRSLDLGIAVSHFEIAAGALPATGKSLG